MRTFEHSKSTDHLGRYYTRSEISSFLVTLLPSDNPGTVLDLGAGEGALTVAASSKWSDAGLITVDVDNSASSKLKQRLKMSGFSGHHHHLPCDALSAGLKTALSKHNNIGPDVAVCNPPFLVPKWRKGYAEILEEAGFSGALPSITSTDSAVLFLAQNLRLIVDGGSVGIIVPDSLVSAEKYQGFRTSLLEVYDVQHAIRLNRGAFVGTDALAHILIISKRRPASDFVRLSSFSSGVSPITNIEISRDQAIRRLDYAYHAADKIENRSLTKLSDILIDLRRGTLNSAEVRTSKSFVLHTTNLSAAMRGQWIDFSRRSYKPGIDSNETTIAEQGDVILARVGRNAAIKVIGVSRGRVALSDCLYRLRILPEHRERTLNYLASEPGHRWLEMNAYGVAARHISKSDLLNLPLPAL